jgi:stearoyl-CoA desaturase (delta-9 desaturase)
LAYLIAEWTGVAALWMMSIIVYNLGDAVNSFGHLQGKRPFRATHMARNNRLLAYLTLGEGWHANHHVFSRSARHGLLPHQFDYTWQVIRVLERVGIASAIILPHPKHIRKRLLAEHGPQQALAENLSCAQSSNQR